jgi:hypothetical protein
LWVRPGDGAHPQWRLAFEGHDPAEFVPHCKDAVKNLGEQNVKMVWARDNQYYQIDYYQLRRLVGG